jgi:Dolichyl-phosphate-mannose-protein mannosyltransferase
MVVFTVRNYNKQLLDCYAESLPRMPKDIFKTMKRPYVTLFAIILGGLILRLLLLSLIQNPGLNDQNHYYNLGQRLAQGQGFTIDYVWYYSRVPDEIVHPIDHWMPLAGVAVAVGMSLGGETPQGALILFILTGTLLPLLAYLATKQLNDSDAAALIAAAFTAVLPDIVWNSLRTDTTIFNMMLITGSVLLLNDGLRKNRWWAFVLSGIGVGLAYLTRYDSILFLPMLVVVLALYLWKGRDRVSLRAIGFAITLIPLAVVVTISPWLIRNQQELGLLGTAETSRMFFMVDQRDHYAYDTPITLETMLEQQTVSELATKRLFEVGAAVKQMVISLDILILIIPLGLGWLLWKRDWDRLLLISPVLIWIVGILVAYPILLPLKSQSGSFEKAYLTVILLLIPIGALMIDQFIRHPIAKGLLVGVAVIWMSLNSYSAVRQETTFADTYYASIQVLVDTLETMPDVTGDGEIRIMSQDPYVMSTFGYKSIMTPLATREQTIELAQRYQIDYLLMPPGRPALDNLYLGQEVDERFILSARIEDAGVRVFELYRFVWG